MQDNNLFEYAIIRVVPKVEREEFMNVGIILYCPSLRFLQSSLELNGRRLLALCPAIEIDDLAKRLQAFQRICEGGTDGGPIGQLPAASRFRWLTAAKSTIIQTSPVHSGLCGNAETTLQKLHTQLVTC